MYQRATLALNEVSAKLQKRGEKDLELKQLALSNKISKRSLYDVYDLNEKLKAGKGTPEIIEGLNSGELKTSNALAMIKSAEDVDNAIFLIEDKDFQQQMKEKYEPKKYNKGVSEELQNDIFNHELPIPEESKEDRGFRKFLDSLLKIIEYDNTNKKYKGSKKLYPEQIYSTSQFIDGQRFDFTKNNVENFHTVISEIAEFLGLDLDKPEESKKNEDGFYLVAIRPSKNHLEEEEEKKSELEQKQKEEDKEREELYKQMEEKDKETIRKAIEQSTEESEEKPTVCDLPPLPTENESRPKGICADCKYLPECPTCGSALIDNRVSKCRPVNYCECPKEQHLFNYVYFEPTTKNKKCKDYVPRG